MQTHVHTLCVTHAGLARGADRPGQEVAATISLKHIYEIARLKQQDTPDLDLQVKGQE
jgi:large subunit ribosomal protein L11